MVSELLVEYISIQKRHICFLNYNLNWNFIGLQTNDINTSKMKRIHFDNMKHRIWLWTSMLILSLVFIILGGFELIEFENPKVNTLISATGFFLQAIYFSRLYWYKNTVQWNNKGMVIRIQSFLGKSFRFDDIKSTKWDGNILTLTTNGKIMTFDLNEFSEPDTEKLNQIITEKATKIKR